MGGARQTTLKQFVAALPIGPFSMTMRWLRIAGVLLLLVLVASASVAAIVWHHSRCSRRCNNT